MPSPPVTPNTIGGYFTKMIVFFPAPVIATGDGGRADQAGWTGSAATIAVNSDYVDDTSSTAVTGTWFPIWFPEDHKHDPWSGEFIRDYALGSSEPHPGVDNAFVADSPTPVYGSLPIQSQAFYDNAWNSGLVGPEQNAVRNSCCWVAISNQPAAGVTDLDAVKSYPANQVNFSSPVPVSSFQQIRSYADATSPASSSGTVRYEAAWDIYGHAHTAYSGITLEVMFWTYNHGQDPHIGSTAPVETGIDLNGDGKLWDLYMTPDTAATGGVTGSYSYGIWYLEDAYQESAGWVNILAGLRYFLKYYVVPSGPGAPSSPLDIPLVQITRGWEVCCTDFTPLEFRLNDYRLQMS